jgi:L-2,4-diaminobutyrate transaminase
MLGTGGIVPPPEGYWQAIEPILRKHDILLIADEVVTGFRAARLHVRLAPLRDHA